jgi:hypothetical protein
MNQGGWVPIQHSLHLHNFLLNGTRITIIDSDTENLLSHSCCISISKDQAKEYDALWIENTTAFASTVKMTWDIGLSNKNVTHYVTLLSEWSYITWKVHFRQKTLRLNSICRVETRLTMIKIHCTPPTKSLSKITIPPVLCGKSTIFKCAASFVGHLFAVFVVQADELCSSLKSYQNKHQTILSPRWGYFWLFMIHIGCACIDLSLIRVYMHLSLNLDWYWASITTDQSSNHSKLCEETESRRPCLSSKLAICYQTSPCES